MNNLVAWHKKARAQNAAFKQFYALAFFSRNLNIRMGRNITEGLSKSEWQLVLNAWKVKLRWLHEIELEQFFKKKEVQPYFKQAEKSLKEWQEKLNKAYKK